MSFRDFSCRTALVVAMCTNVYAIKVNDFDVALTDDQKLSEIYKADVYRAIAADVLRQYWNAHMDAVRLKNRQAGVESEVTK